MVLAGGTDLMVEVNFGHRRPDDVLSLRAGRRAARLAGRARAGRPRRGGPRRRRHLHRLLGRQLAALLPALAQAARTVGSPQIRNAGTIGGNLGTGSPAGDTLPGARRARRHGASWRRPPAAGGRCRSPSSCVGPKRTARRPGELIVAVRRPGAGRPGRSYLKVGVRNAMVIAVASCALVVDRDRRRVAVALGSVGPDAAARPRRRGVGRRPGSTGTATRRSTRRCWTSFGRRVAAAARPIDDHRSTADYRRHAVGVLARRALRTSAVRRGDRDRCLRRCASTATEHRGSTTPGSARACCYVLRERLGLPGAKSACEQGECGSCSRAGRRRAGVLLPGAGRPSAVGQPRSPPSRATRRPAARAHRRAAGVRRRRGACSAGSARRGWSWPSHDLLDRVPAPDRARGPRGAVRQPVPLHRLRPDRRRRRSRSSAQRAEASAP